METPEYEDEDDVEDVDVDGVVVVVAVVVVIGLRWIMAAALVAAAWTSRGEQESGRGKTPASSGKLRIADEPFIESAATSCARAAISGSEKVPSQIRDFFLGSRISDTHLPHARIRTPR